MSSSSVPVDAEEKADILKKRRIDTLSSYCFKIPYDDTNLPDKVYHSLPCVSKAFLTRDLSSLHNFILKGSPYVDPKNTYALENEVVALCIWFLFANSTPADIKELLVCSLKRFIFDENSTDNSADEASLEDLIVRVLHNKDVEVIRQVFYAFNFSFDIYKKSLSTTFGFKILDNLLMFVDKDDKELAWPVIRGIIGAVDCFNGLSGGIYISSYNTDIYRSCIEEKRTKLVNDELSRHWLGRFLERNLDSEIMADACWILSFMLEEDNNTLWDHVIGKLVPLIVKAGFGTNCSTNLLIAAGSVICRIASYATPFQIRTLVDMQCLRLLLEVCDAGNPGESGASLRAIEIILEAGDKDEDKDDDEDEYDDWKCLDRHLNNDYAKLIDGYKPGWEVLLFKGYLYWDIDEGYEIVKKYRPRYCQK